MDRKLRGVVFSKLVELIQGSKDLPWEDHLDPEDMDMLKSMVLPGEWYPAESYNRMGLAVYELLFKHNPDEITKLGKASMEEMLEGMYGPHLKGREPDKAIEKYLSLRRQYMNFSNMQVEKTSEKSCRITISETGSFDTSEMLHLQFSAQFEVLVKVNGGKFPKVEFKVIEDAGEPEYIFEIEWS